MGQFFPQQRLGRILPVPTDEDRAEKVSLLAHQAEYGDLYVQDTQSQMHAGHDDGREQGTAPGPFTVGAHNLPTTICGAVEFIS